MSNPAWSSKARSSNSALQSMIRVGFTLFINSVTSAAFVIADPTQICSVILL